MPYTADAKLMGSTPTLAARRRPPGEPVAQRDIGNRHVTGEGQPHVLDLDSGCDALQCTLQGKRTRRWSSSRSDSNSPGRSEESTSIVIVGFSAATRASKNAQRGATQIGHAAPPRLFLRIRHPSA